MIFERAIQRLSLLSLVVVRSSYWEFNDGEAWDCDKSVMARGNYVILDHDGIDPDLQTWYFHLSNTGNKPGTGTPFNHRGMYIAISDDTGCSSSDHLHFATKMDGVPFDPDANPDWAGGEPIPMGFRDQNHNVRGPYALDRTKIRNKWLELEGKLGSPLGA